MKNSWTELRHLCFWLLLYGYGVAVKRMSMDDAELDDCDDSRKTKVHWLNEIDLN